MALETVEMQQATDSLPLRSPSESPSPEGAAISVGEEAPVSVSPVVYCSQYKMEEYERQIGPPPGNGKVGYWRQSTGPTDRQLRRLQMLRLH
jgi:hypothetical protein